MCFSSAVNRWPQSKQLRQQESKVAIAWNSEPSLAAFSAYSLSIGVSWGQDLICGLGSFFYAPGLFTESSPSFCWLPATLESQRTQVGFVLLVGSFVPVQFLKASKKDFLLTVIKGGVPLHVTYVIGQTPVSLHQRLGPTGVIMSTSATIWVKEMETQRTESFY